jgi:PAS domain S-box-containing protein
MADAAPSMIWMSGTDRVCTWFNKQWLDFVGRPMEREINGGSTEHVHPDDLVECRRISRSAFDARIPFILEFRLRRHDGEYRWVLDHGVPRVDKNGEFLGYIGSCVDITDRKIAEQTLTQREQYLRAVIETTPECVKIVAPDGALKYMNPAGRKIFGAPEGAELIGTSVYDLIAPESRAAYIAMHDSVCRGRKESLEFDITGFGGDRRHMQTQAVPLQNADGTIDHLAITRDVTERRIVELALRESEERFRTLADNISQFAWTADPSGSVFWYNRRWYDFTGTTFEEMQGSGWRTVLDPDHADRVMRKFREHIDAGIPWEDLFPLRGKDGEYRWFLSRALPIRDDEGRVVRWFGTNTDVTEHREAEQALERYKNELEKRVEERTQELQESHERLRLSERMASLGTLSAGLGHDMGNLLVPVRVCVEMLEQAELDAELRAHVTEIKTSAEYLQQLASGLRLMAIDPGRARATESTNLRQWWRTAAMVMKTALPQGIRLEADFPDGCWARISEAALTQTVFNLVQNAGSAMASRRSGVVRLSGRTEDGLAVLEVEDDGPGMTPEVRSRCMEPFFTTKPRGISTGLGLVLVAGLVRDVGGTVDLWSEPGRGTRFTIRVRAGASRNAGRESTPARGRAAIFLDDARLRAFVTGELRAMRFEITDPHADDGPLELAVVQKGLDANGAAGRARQVMLVGGSGGNGAEGATCTVSARPSSIREALQQLAGPAPDGEERV